MFSSVHLPDDIITREILVKIPCPKSVLRCTSVCKSWYSFINCPLFINLHLYGAKHTKYLLCNYEAPCLNKLPYLSIQYDTEAFVEHYRLVYPSKLRSYDRLIIHGCCNGLICYTTRLNKDYIHLWNPAIRRLRVLPNYPYHENLCGTYEAYFRGFGFWFDKRMNDYMVAVIFYTRRKSFIDIYSLSSNSWRIISHSIPGMYSARPFRLPPDLEHVAGTLHWPAVRSESCMIYSLDIETGMFRETLLPLPWSSRINEMDINLTAFGEHSLAVFGSKSTNANTWRCFIVLVYDQNLNKSYTIDLEKDTCHVLRCMVGFRNNGEVLFPKLDLNDWGIISCNIETKDFEEFVWEVNYNVMFVKWYGGRILQRALQRVRPFIETLVLLNDRHAMKIPTPCYEETDFKEDEVMYG